MNRELFRLAIQGLRRKKKSSLILFLVLFLSFAFAIITLSVNGSMAATNAEFKQDTYGEWDGAILNGTAEDEEFLRNESWLNELAIVPQAGGIAAQNPITGETSGFRTGIGVWNDAFTAMGRLELQEGQWPETSDEIVIEAKLLTEMGLSYELGQEISLPAAFRAGDVFVQTEKVFILCGILKDYTNVWETDYYGNDKEPSTRLDGAFITADAAAELREWANAATARKAAELGEEIALDSEDTCYFFTVKSGTLNAMKTSVTVHQRQTSKSSTGVTLNGGGWAGSEEAGYNAVYTVLIFAATFLSVLCVYAVQLQKQVRQITLFRSIGATHKQLGLLLLYETLCLCAPAVLLGAALGWAGTWGVLHLLVNASGMPIIVDIPWNLIGPLLVVWALVVFVARLSILGLALREPLTGRMAMSSKKARRYHLVRVGLVSLLSILLGTTVLFAGLELLRHIFLMDYWSNLPSYEITMEYLYPTSYDPENTPDMITEERLAQFQTIPGVTKTVAHIALKAVPWFDGIEQNDYFNSEYFYLSGNEAWVAQEMGVLIYALPEENWGDYLDLDKMGVDIDAFREGEQVVLSFPMAQDGSYIFYRLNQEKKDADVISSLWTTQYITDVGIEPGDHLILNIKGLTPDSFISRNPTSTFLKSVEVTVGGIQGLDPARFEMDKFYDFSRAPYTVWCSINFARSLLSDIEPGHMIDHYYTGSEFGYTNVDIYTDTTADYISTDKAVDRILSESNIWATSLARETNATQKQEEQQAIVLLAVGGGCLAVVLLMILSNTLAAEAQQERKRYGVLQALGMSRRQMVMELTRTALLRGLVSAVAGWVVFGGYVLLSARELETIHPGHWAWALGKTLRDYQIAGLDLPFCLALTLGAMIFVTAVTLLSKRQLFRENLMTKLREER